MLKKVIYLLFTAALFSIVSTGSMPNPQNPPTANTGAPGETTCMLSGCHSGGSFTGTVNITGVPDTVFANQTYTITITNTSNAVRAGFELTVLDANNTFVGTLIKGTNVSIAKDANTRTYARHSNAIFLSNGSASWTFQWKAPASATKDTFTFYFASLCANGDGNNSKDNSIKNSKKVLFSLPVANSDLNASKEASILIQNGQLIIKDEQNRIANHIVIAGLSGNIVYQSMTPVNGSMTLPASLHGLYFVQYEISQTTRTAKVFIP